MSLTKRILVCFVAVAVAITCSSPLSIKAARTLGENDVDLYYITYQANVNNQTMIDNGYNQTPAIGGVSHYMVNNQITSSNSFGLPSGIDLSEWDYYILLGNNSWQGDNFSSRGISGLLVYNSDSPMILYHARTKLQNFAYDAVGYQNGTYGWDRGSFNIYKSDLNDMFSNGDARIFYTSGDDWIEFNSPSVYDGVSIQLNGTYIASTNHPNFYYGKDIAVNSTYAISDYYSINQLSSWLIDGCEKSPNLMETFQVTKDGTNYEGWDDAFGESDLDLQGDTTLAFASCDCTPIKDGYNPLTNAYAEWTIDTGSFDFTFGGDQTKQAAAMNKWGVSFDVGIQYKIVGTNGNKNIASTGASGTIYSHIDYNNLSQEEFLNGSYTISLSELVQDASSYSGGDAGAYLMGLFAMREEVPGIVTAFNGSLVTGGDPVGDEVGETAWNIVTSGVPILGGLSYDQINRVFNSSLNYMLAECRYDVVMHPVNTGLGIQGQKGEAYCDLNTGVHNGRATGAVIPPANEDGNEVIRPDYSSGDNQNFYYPVTLPGGGSGLALQEGSPSSNANATGGTGYGGSATANVQFESGIKGLTDRFLEEEGKEDWSKSWWSVFGTFKDNPASGLYSEYFGWLPEEFMKFLLSIASVVFLVGAARFIRRG